ncbi:DUF1311 domain-containing protein [Budviciaceae bacterium BWR-B9]|uniref:DUF1311 domain-containing protein n=1 Tax=Limnobaculum allomyrinae TaxID=2791986 RepID=A0ABS1ILK2_9GAMM|nr:MULTISPECIES: lysozyme inhibitor LprI family protein [Limnobaculum]MBK5142467.1 DUF1311 domain-containing protein [Limnobaculum allomyrinae]MBV7690648.1 DUF1311 domain-containing protein [Limnobaculum sp. M2-1]
MRRILVALTVMVSANALAAGCAAPRNAFDQVYCSSTEFSQLDRDLNQQYSRVVKLVSAEQKAILKKSQLNWIKQRDDNCSEEKSSGYFVNLTCANNMMNERIAFLKERERECSSTGCVSSKLAD